MKLTENTLVPISLVILIGSGFYMFAKVSLATDRNTSDVRALQVDVMSILKEQSDTLSDLRAQTAAIEEKLNSVSDRLNRMAGRK